MSEHVNNTGHNNGGEVDKQVLFIMAMESLKEYAKVSGGRVSKQDILEHFKEIDMTEEQFQLVYGYLAAGNIEIVDVDIQENKFKEMLEEDAKKAELENEEGENVPTDNLDYSQDDKFINGYLDDLSSVDVLSETTEAALLINISERDDKALKVLIESYLSKIVSWIEPYKRQGILAADLIQEANLTMISYLSDKTWLSKRDRIEKIEAGMINDLLNIKRELENEVKSEIEKVIVELIAAQRDVKKIDKKVLIKVNLVNEWAKRLREELGRKVTVEEIAERMGITVEEVKEAVDFTSNAIEEITGEAEVVEAGKEID